MSTKNKTAKNTNEQPAVITITIEQLGVIADKVLKEQNAVKLAHKRSLVANIELAYNISQYATQQNCSLNEAQTLVSTKFGVSSAHLRKNAPLARAYSFTKELSNNSKYGTASASLNLIKKSDEVDVKIDSYAVFTEFLSAFAKALAEVEKPTAVERFYTSISEAKLSNSEIESLINKLKKLL